MLQEQQSVLKDIQTQQREARGEQIDLRNRVVELEEKILKFESAAASPKSAKEFKTRVTRELSVSVTFTTSSLLYCINMFLIPRV